MKDLLYITYKIMPFIMVAYLLITTIFANSIGGLMALVGLGISAVITIAVSKAQAFSSNSNAQPSNNIIALSDTVMSTLPLSTNTFAYMLAYFVYVTIKNDIVSNNGLLIGVLTLILGGDLYYNSNNNNGFKAIVAIVIGGLWGIAWPAMLSSSMLMVPQSAEQSQCNVKKGIYRCRIKRTGEIVQ